MYFIGYKDERDNNRMYCFKGYDKFNSPEFDDTCMKFYENLEDAKLALKHIYEDNIPVIFNMDNCKIYKIPLSTKEFNELKPVYDYEDYENDMNAKFSLDWRAVILSITNNHKRIYMDQSGKFYFWFVPADCLVYTKDLCPTANEYNNDKDGYNSPYKFTSVAVDSFFTNQKFALVELK